ncbi:hypothetical protein ACQPU1_07710 [Clostridium paraputrificum]|uniref:hypothetical protein n=1 Tax=Clostridium paraputrificum TaxID=29363 RepID=UPI003D3403C5
MRKIVSIILIVILTSLSLVGCGFKFKLDFSKSDYDIEEIVETGKVETVEDLKKVNSRRYRNLTKDLYDNEEMLLSKDDDYLFTVKEYSPFRSSFGMSFKYFRGYKTMAYFYRYRQTTDNITFRYKGALEKGRCKVIIISPSLEIVSSIDLNGEGAIDVPITEDGNYYVRLIGDDASGEVELDAKGNDLVYKFAPESFEKAIDTGLYDYP